MADLAELQKQIAECETRGDFNGITALRAQIARDFPGTPAAAEALFRLGLYFLFALGQVPEAMQTLEEAIKIKDGQWSKAARVSLASLYLREDKPQKALLELRKTLGANEPPSVHTVSALSIIELIHERAGDTLLLAEAKREKVKHLEALIAESRKQKDDPSLAYFLVSLGAEGTAAEPYEEVLAMGAARAGEALIKEATAALRARA
jgi:tetratricopeptide (TPR) repeat protein